MTKEIFNSLYPFKGIALRAGAYYFHPITATLIPPDHLNYNHERSHPAFGGTNRAVYLANLSALSADRQDSI